MYNSVFVGEEEFCREFFARFYKEENAVIKRIGGNIVSALHLIPVSLGCEKEKYSARYIFAAATKKEFRGKGYMSELIKEAIKRSKESNEDFVFLILGEESLNGYYSRFGFQSVSSKKETVVLPAAGKAEKADVSELKARLDAAGGLHVIYGESFLYNMLKAYGAEIYCGFNSVCAVYTDGDFAVFPKSEGNEKEKLCSAVTELLKAKRGVICESSPVMVLPLNDRAGSVKHFDINFLLD
ncbi:MAG: GNAT family N-acetyltransferase [Acutalibacteraceae bacterium]